MLRGGCLSQDDVQQLKRVLNGTAPLVPADEKDTMQTLMGLIRERIALEGANVPPVSIRGALVDRRIQELIWDKTSSKPLDYKASFCYNSHVIHTVERYQYKDEPLPAGASFQCRPERIAKVSENCSPYARASPVFATVAEEHPEYVVRLGANLSRDREIREALTDSELFENEMDDMPSYGLRVPQSNSPVQVPRFIRSETPGRTPVNF